MADMLPNPSASDGSIEDTAAQWLAKRDRGFTPAEQDEFFDWRSRDPRHAAAVRKLDRAWHALDALAQWRPEHSAAPNPDLLAGPIRPEPAVKRRGPLVFAVCGLAAAAAVAIAVGIVNSRRSAAGPAIAAVATPAATRVHPAPDKTALPDGSVVQVNHGGKIEPGFTPALRVVRLTEGEAHFTVAHDAARPFVVVAGDIAVRAVGTVFDVRRTETGTDVLVTEGKVQVECAGAAPTPVAAGEKLFLSLAGEPVGGARAVSSAEVERMLAWRSAMLEFDDVPLSAVIGEFNQRNAAQIIIGDVAAGKIPIGGQFRADNAEAFVRLLQRDFGVVVEARSDGAWVLRAAHGK